ncbi:TPA: hypothetical protein RNS95_004325 [Stenotrophomonas maltophilia]|nr:hypothetical protein [Stenotrophomonas maltophilia]
MDLLNFVKDSGAPVVIVDDLLAAPKITIRADVKAQWRAELRDDGNRVSVARILGLADDASSGEVFAESVDRANELWERYSANMDEHSVLTPLLSAAISQNAPAKRAHDLIAQLKQLGLDPKEYSSLEDASEDLARCCIAFIDLYLDPLKQNDLEDMVATHERYRIQYRQMFEANGTRWPKLIVLMSSNLPEDDKLRRFRSLTGIRSAFFKGLRKSDIDSATVSGLLSSWGERYAQTASMGRYLDEVSGLVATAADRVLSDINRLEVHDLAVLDMARLMADEANLHSYLGWLVSEQMAAKARNLFAERSASAPARATSGSVDPRLVDNSALFDLFAEIAVTPIDRNSARPEFGEILARANVARDSTFEVLVAISPACDLARCTADFEVLLMRGLLRPSSRDTATLLKQGATYGKGNSFVTYEDGGETRQGLVEWQKDAILTRPAGELNDPAQFVRLARLSEIFAHEVKDYLLSNLSRVGLPVSPNIQEVASVEVNLSLPVGAGVPPVTLREVAPHAEVAAMVSRGRLPGENDEGEIVMLTAYFREWLLGRLRQVLAPHASNAKAKKILEALEAWDVWTVAFSNGKIPDCNDVAIKRGTMPEKSATGLQIYVSQPK